MLNALDAVIFQTSAMQEAFKRTSVNPYAEQTGGEMTGASKDEVNARLGEMIDRLRSRYVLGYQPVNQKFDGKFRRIKLSLTSEARRRLRGEIAINAKQGYYAVDPESEELLAAAPVEPPQNAPAIIRLGPPATMHPETSPAPANVEKPAAADASQPAAPFNAQALAAFKAAFKRPNPYAHLVMVDVQAMNKKTGTPVGNLAREDFAVEDNGVRREIEYFSQSKLPLSIILLIDVSGNTPVMMSSLRRGVAQWLRQVGPEDEIALMAFGSNAEVIQSFTKDRKLIAAGFKNFIESAREKKVGGFQDRSKAVFLAADLMDKAANPIGRRAIITITDDKPTLYTEMKTDAAAQLLSHTDSVVYGVVTKGPGKPVKGKLMKQAAHAALFSFGNPVSFAIQMATQIATEKAMDAILKDRGFGQLVQRTGGVIVKSESEDAAEKLHLLLGHLRTRYVVGFSPVAPAANEKFHLLKVKLNQESNNRAGELSLLTAQGYFVRKPGQGNDPSAAKAEEKSIGQKQN
jgi:VWFA-related protein